ncbi:zinc ribbon domain-containing protein [Natronococcus sp. JC468]|uniref:zinc ribbon domain-containing protein n=1 Tax=Natronococcus sp. JC468 TaxID=1961921 RepID=UPI0014393D93|nr:zinc ribbon domain-containing protein [Natronococcus sp. JC468]NKE35605.1 zinc ribbon domain-containing protein [Natronococcus sp. JC468]
MRNDRRRGSRVDGPYCTHCGEALELSMNFCPDCGRHVGGADGSASRSTLERRVAAATADGWTLEHDFGDRVVMVRRTVGGRNEHLVVAALSVWWTMGLGNALYGLYRYVSDAERTVLRADPSTDERNAGSRFETVGRIAGAGCLATAVALAGFAAVPASPTVTPLLAAVAVGLATVGLGLFPGVRRRLENRRSPSANGLVRSVEESAIVDYERSCTACDGPVGRGLERTYRKGVYVLGVPLTLSEGHNAYCGRCATEATEDSRSVGETTIPITDSSPGERESEPRR